MNLRQPFWPRFLPSRTIVNIATLGPIGRVRKAPGTAGSVAGVFWFTLIFYPLGVVGTVLLGALTVYFAVAFCGEAERRIGRPDPSEVVLDEFVAVPFCFLGWLNLVERHPPWLVLLAGFLLFRLFDIWKPFWIDRLQRLPEGWGVVMDDVGAALTTCAVLHVTVALAPPL